MLVAQYENFQTTSLPISDDDSKLPERKKVLTDNTGVKSRVDYGSPERTKTLRMHSHQASLVRYQKQLDSHKPSTVQTSIDQIRARKIIYQSSEL